jgi:hypothetical protein
MLSVIRKIESERYLITIDYNQIIFFTYYQNLLTHYKKDILNGI